MDIEYIINKCIVSDDIRNHLLKHEEELTASQLCKIVDGAPIELVEKNSIFKELHDNNPKEIRYMQYQVDYELAVKNCVADEDEFFIEYYYEIDDDNDHKHHKHPRAIYRGRIMSLFNPCRNTTHKKGYSQIEKWKLNPENNTYDYMYTFYTYNGGICFYETAPLYDSYVRDSDVDAPCEKYQMDPTPFKRGDILMIDCTPYMPMMRAIVWDVDNMGQLIVEVEGDNRQPVYMPLSQITNRSPLSPLYKTRKILEYSPEYLTDKELVKFGILY